MSLRCKFEVDSVTLAKHCASLSMKPIYDPKGEIAPENKVFWDATPSGKLEIQVNTPEGIEECKRMKPGDHYYLDITKCKAQPSK